MSISQYPAASGGAGTSAATKYIGTVNSAATGTVQVDSNAKNQVLKKIATSYYSARVSPKDNASASGFFWTSGSYWSHIGEFNDELRIGSYSSGYITQYPTASYSVISNPSARDVAIADTYIERKFIAAGNSGRYYTSTDGNEWVDRGYIDAMSYSTVYSIVFYEGKFLAAGASGKTAASSDGGVTWQGGNLGSSSAIDSQIYTANGKFWIVSDNNIMSSTDGITWTSSDTISGLSRSLGYASFAYGNGTYILVNRTGQKVYSSTDGVSWSEITSAFAAYSGSPIRAIAYGDNKFVALSAGVTWTSTDGSSWTAQLGSNYSTVFSNTEITGLQYIGNRFVVLDSASGQYRAISSTDGLVWEDMGRYSKQPAKYFKEDNGVFYMAGVNYLSKTTDLSKKAQDFAIDKFTSVRAIA